MAGDTEYMQAFGTHAGDMEWLIWPRDRPKFHIEKRLRSIKHWLGSPRATEAAREHPMV